MMARMENQLLKLRIRDIETLNRWMHGRYKQYTRWAVQNEIQELSELSTGVPPG